MDNGGRIIAAASTGVSAAGFSGSGVLASALGMAPALMVGWIEGGAGFILFSVLPGGVPIFRLALAVFIPWRGADGFDRRAGWHPR